MLTSLRKLAATWVAKALFTLLIASFAIWGIEDSFRNWGRDDAVARVDGQPIQADEAQQATRREIARITRQVGRNLEITEDIRRAVAAQAVETLVLDRVMRSEARRLGVVAPDDAVRATVFSIPDLHGIDGRFSPERLAQILRSESLTEAQFLAMIRGGLERRQVAGAVRAGAAAPAAIAEPLTRFANERRIAEVAQFPVAAAPEPPAPTEAQLRRFHENNPERFSTPALRDAVVAVLTADMLAGQATVTDAEIGAAYDQRRSQFETPERRVLQQVVLQDEAAARTLADRWKAGAAWPEIEAAAREASGQAVELPETDRAGLPLPALAEAAFALAPGAVSDPVRSPFGWHVLRAERITPGATRTLADVRTELRQEIANEKALDLVFQRSTQLEDQLAGGATLEEVARRNNLRFAAVRLDAEGRDADGQEVALPVRPAQRPETLRLIFAANPGDAARLNETVDGFIAVELREVVAPTLRPFETVEPAVRAAFIEDAKRRHQEEAATAMLTALRAGTPFAEAAVAANATAGRVGPFGRQPQADTAIPPELVSPIFELARGEATMAATRTGFAVGQVAEIATADLTAEAEALTAMRAEVTRSIGDDLEFEFLTALRARSTIRTNRQQMESLTR